MDPELRCPKCATTMHKRVAQPRPDARTIAADYCDRCATLFFDEDELADVSAALVRARYRAMLGKDVVEGIGERPPCPRCDSRGERGFCTIDVLGVKLDLCLTCKGMLFDAGEYEALALALAEAQSESRAGSYRSAPQAARAASGDSFACARCGDATHNSEAMIVPAGRVCARCYYEFEEPSLQAGQGDGELREMMLANRLGRPDAEVKAGSIMHDLLAGMFLPRYCSRCGRPRGSCDH